MPDEIVFVVIAENLPDFTQVFHTYKEAEEYCKGWHPITMLIMPAFQAATGRLTLASLN